jgi:hypothetical protein
LFFSVLSVVSVVSVLEEFCFLKSDASLGNFSPARLSLALGVVSFDFQAESRPGRVSG